MRSKIKNDMRLILPLLLSALFFQTCSQPAELIQIPYNHKHVYYEGRIGDNGIEHAEIYWPGSSFSLKFHGESIQTTLEDQNGENYFNVIVDGTHVALLHLSKGG